MNVPMELNLLFNFNQEQLKKSNHQLEKQSK